MKPQTIDWDALKKNLALMNALCPSFGHQYLPAMLGTLHGPVAKACDEVVLKWTKETFDESEVKRDGGKFAEENGAPATNAIPEAPKARGGARAGAGRLPKEAHLAVEKIRQRVKETNPDWNDEQVKGELLKQAEERGKPDWELYINDPAGYTEKLKRQAREVAETKYGRTTSHGERISKIDDPSETDTIKKSLRTSEREFKREVEHQRTLKDAWDSFRDKNSTDVEKNHARLVMAVAGAVGLLGAGAFLMRIPGTGFGARIMEIDPQAAREALEKFATERFAKGKKFKGRIPVDDLTGEIGHIPQVLEDSELPILQNATWYRLRKVIDNTTNAPAGTLAYDPILHVSRSENLGVLGPIYKKLGTYLAKKQGLPPGEYVWTPGERVFGYGRGSIWSPRDWKTFDRAKTRFAAQDLVKAGDVDSSTGIQYVKSTGELDLGAIFNIKRLYLKDPLRKGSAIKSTKELADIEVRVERNIASSNPKDMNVIIEDHELFDKYWIETFGVIDPKTGVHLPGDNGQKYTLEDFLPRFIARMRSKEELDVLQKVSESYYISAADFVLKELNPTVTKKVLASLVVGGGLGSGTAYSFSRRSESLNQAWERQKDEDQSMDLAIERAKIADRSKPSKEEQKAQRDLEKKRIAQATARSKEKEKEHELELERIREGRWEKVREQEKNDARQTATMGYSQDLVTKQYVQETVIGAPPDDLTFEELTDNLAEDVVGLITDTSECCKIVMDSGMPGHSDYEELNSQLVLLYQCMKAIAKAHDQKIADETSRGTPQF